MKKFIIFAGFFVLLAKPSMSIEFPVIEGWKSGSVVRIYDPSNLYEYINGAADQFIHYGFEKLLSRDLEKGELAVTVDIYDMGTTLNAFGVYQIEKPRNKEMLNIGIQGVMYLPYQSLLLKDRYYVKINILDGEITNKIATELLHLLATSLPGSNNIPTEIKQLPQNSKIKDSEGFVKESFLGLSELTNCLFADYEIDGKKFKYFFIVPGTDEDSNTIWKSLKNKWEILEYKNHKILYKKNPYTGLNAVVLKDKKIWGVTDCSSENEIFERLIKIL